MKAFYSILRSVVYKLGLKQKPRSESRKWIEEELFPKLLADERYQKILFVGCDEATKSYPQIFQSKEFWTIDIDPNRAQFGSENHIIAPLEDLPLHSEPSWFDLIICHGVIGWGLDQEANVEKALASCYRALRPEGLLILGWNDLPERGSTLISHSKVLTAFTRPNDYLEQRFDDTNAATIRFYRK